MTPALLAATLKHPLSQAAQLDAINGIFTWEQAAGIVLDVARDILRADCSGVGAGWGSGAMWCAIHGTCSCNWAAATNSAFDDPNCPLHGEDTDHGPR